MYCENCGSQLSEISKFCEKCGNKVERNIENEEVESSIDKNEVVLEIKPTVKFLYLLFPKLLRSLVLLFPAIFFLPIVMDTIKIAQSFQGEANGIGKMFMTGMLVFAIGYIVIVLGAAFIKTFIAKKQYDNMRYYFYKDRVVYKDSFLNKSEQELKYKYVREVARKESITQRIFNLGSIVISSNAEGGATGITVYDIENTNEYYKKIKELINV